MELRPGIGAVRERPYASPIAIDFLTRVISDTGANR
jgi:hypothetical protein